MREIRLGDATVRIAANALLPIVFENEFRRDLMGVIAPLVAASNASTLTGEAVDMSAVSIADMERLLWAEVKAADSHNVQSFMPWVEALPEDALADLFGGDKPIATEIYAELQHGFLSQSGRTRQTAGAKTSRKS